MGEMSEQRLVINVAGLFTPTHDFPDLAYQLNGSVIGTSEAGPKTRLLEEVWGGISKCWRLNVKN
jgi:hypothetical protein